MKIYIKYMVSLRCKLMVKSELDKLGVRYGAVELGEVELLDAISGKKRMQLKAALFRSGLELMDDTKSVLIEKVKNMITEMVHRAEEYPNEKHSTYISEKLNVDYAQLANLFSAATGTTIEHYIIAHKIERVKEFLIYNELNLTEISYKMNYSSVSHLSAQFKKVTGLTPSYFKELIMHRKRIVLDNV